MDGSSSFTRLQGTSRATLDFILLSQKLAEGEGSRWERNINTFGSDHIMIQASVCIQAPRLKVKPIKQSSIRFSVLRDGDMRAGLTSLEDIKFYRSKFHDVVCSNLDTWAAKWRPKVTSTTVEDLNVALTEMAQVFKKAGKEVLGETSVSSKYCKAFWSDELSEKVKRRGDAYKKMMEEPRVSEEMWEEYREIAQEARDAIQASKRRNWQATAKAVSHARKQPSKSHMWKLVLSTARRGIGSANPLYVRKPDGKITTSPEEAAQVIRRKVHHFSVQDLFKIFISRPNLSSFFSLQEFDFKAI